ncbi:Rieske (2Fe-2S) protein [Saccharomonospora xinjiangensis]|uniref:Cytochrome bc1 complex Rieske iron-sulfur subunit n=1 Tax=Saccharomonospora xinjiangensis XJ-54 TaxID=882086 RepID=I0UXJ1_9PSEU|nr:Rieske (2Fe-2S) protein [Saccharomonospora xinjiangensis]EID52594.1 ferredoxin subunit of nitrite reductase and ring-hydroxylating dioxygenase [Saccharomonospora xinjiangensis XJ-54]
MNGHAHSRRTVLTTGAAVAGAALGTAALASCSGGGPGQGGQSQPAPKGARLAGLDEVPIGTARPVTTPDGHKIIISRRSENEVAGFSAVCTHQGCTVAPEPEQLRCPCHNSLFDKFTGAVRGGPADAPLRPINVAIEGDDIVTA